MKKSRLLGTVCAVMFLFATVSANAALYSRLGGEEAYDDVLQITWLTNAGLSGGIGTTWQGQLDWVAGLNSANYLGFNDWRMATMSVTAGLPIGTVTQFQEIVNCRDVSEEVCRDNELGYMFYYILGGAYLDDLTGDHTVGDVTLTNIKHGYWSPTEYDDDYDDSALSFFFNRGSQSLDFKDTSLFYSWAVRSGDVGVIPIPAAVWLFGSGLLGLVGISRRRKIAEPDKNKHQPKPDNKQKNAHPDGEDGVRE